jgi:L-malate glycosyltransferase
LAADKPAILHLSTESGWRGGERQVLLLMRGLAERGWRQTLVAPRNAPLVAEARAHGFTVIPLRATAVIDPVGIYRLVKRLRREPDTILHAHTARAFDQARLLRALARARGLVVTRRVSFPVRRSNKYRNAADRYVAISRAISELLIDSGTPRERVVIIPSAVDFAALDKAPTLTESPFPGQRLVGCVAQMTSEKGVTVLARAWAAVSAAIPEARLVIVGDGPERAEVERILTHDGVAATVHLTGFRSDVASWLKAFSCYVQPSLQEGLGSTAIDALALALPTVASRVGGLPEVVLADNGGLLVPPNDPAALAGSIVNLLRDRTTAQRLGEHGRAHVRNAFAIERMIDQYEALYRGLSCSGAGEEGA